MCSRFPCVGRQTAKIDHFEWGEARRGHVLDRGTVNHSIRRTQDFMTRHHLIQRPLPQRSLHRDAKPECERPVVRRASGVQLIQEPEPFLPIGQRESSPGRGPARNYGARRCAPLFLVEFTGQGFQLSQRVIGDLPGNIHRNFLDAVRDL